MIACLIDLFERLSHFILARLDRVHLLHETVLRVVVDEVDPFPALPVVDALGGDPHGSLSLCECAFQLLTSLHQVVSFVHVALKFRLEEERC